MKEKARGESSGSPVPQCRQEWDSENETSSPPDHATVGEVCEHKYLKVRPGDMLDTVLAHNRKWVAEFTRQLTAMGLKVYPSQTNFMLVEFPSTTGRTAAEANDRLNRHGIIARQFAVEDFNNKLRFTIGDDAGMETTISVLAEFMNR